MHRANYTVIYRLSMVFLGRRPQFIDRNSSRSKLIIQLQVRAANDGHFCRLTVEDGHRFLESSRLQIGIHKVLQVYQFKHEGNDGCHAILRVLNRVN